MKLEDRMYAETPIETVIKFASHPEWHLDKAHALYELALRALEDKSLLTEAWRCIGNEIVVVSRQGPPLGQAAAAALLDSGVEGVEESLVKSLDSWSREQQADFFLGLYSRGERNEAINRLRREYGFVPKVKISSSGDVIS